MKRYSLTRRLITMVLLIELGAALCVSVTAFLYERHMHFRAFDVLLHGRADSLLGAVQDAEDANDNVMLDGSELRLPREDLYEVEDADGRIVGKSTNWPGVSALQSFRNGRGGPMYGPGREDSHPLEQADPYPSSDRKEAFTKAEIDGKDFRIIRIEGLRIVDPGDKNGGTRRYVTVFYGSPVHRVWNAIFGAVEFYAGISLAVLAITGILMAWLLSQGLSPLRGLASAAQRVSVASWSFEPPGMARETEELEPLVSALELLLEGLQLSFEKQKRFVGDAAHELKTGVAVVKSSIQLLAMKPRSQQEYQAGLERCLSDCQRMEDLVAQMLTLARIEESFAVPAFHTVAVLLQAMEEVAFELQPMSESKRITVHVADVNSLIPVSATTSVDPSQFKLLVSNLLLNAIQHSPEASSIHISATLFQESLQFEVRDQGEGIHPSDLPTIFDRFSRGDPSRSRNTGGTGLGLAICKAVADRYQGTIEIVSQPDAGTIVLVRFPLLKIE